MTIALRRGRGGPFLHQLVDAGGHDRLFLSSQTVARTWVGLGYGVSADHCSTAELRCRHRQESNLGPEV